MRGLLWQNSQGVITLWGYFDQFLSSSAHRLVPFLEDRVSSLLRLDSLVLQCGKKHVVYEIDGSLRLASLPSLIDVHIYLVGGWAQINQKLMLVQTP